MTNNMSLAWIFEERLAPWRFSFIIRPQLAAQRIKSLPPSSVISMLSRLDNLRSRTGANPYQTGRDLRIVAAHELERGTLVAINDSCRMWSPMSELFFINSEGRLQSFSTTDVSMIYPVSKIIRRYEEMVNAFGKRPPATVMPPAQLTRYQPAMRGEDPSPGNSRPGNWDETTRPLTKAERWQERKNLIGKGQRSIYPDAQTTANRLAENNVAVEKAKLAQNIYGRAGQPVNALESLPDVPEGWTDISNDENALSSLGLKREMLFDQSAEPNFFSRVYAPDKSVFGNDMNPTVVFRGTRPDKMMDWGNNLAQGGGFHSTYYEKAVNIGSKIAQTGNNVDIAGHSLGGGLASAAGIASGQPTWTYNSAGLKSGTVEKYGGRLIGDGSAISAYRVSGEVLTSVQEISFDNLANANFDLSSPALAMKAGVSNMFPDAIGKAKELSGGTGWTWDKHAMSQVIDCIEAQKDEDIGIIKSRL
ncbi:hypothetical protein [Vagococcus sp. WN89Y]|uniref:hypothetical protein n=1 Tax=Vagococcus sp. WN89Y TaxID=3457258 RepID=UPI003FCC3A60